MSKRQQDLRIKIDRKRSEGNAIAGEVYFKECYEFFCQKAQKEELSEEDM